MKNVSIMRGWKIGIVCLAICLSVPCWADDHGRRGAPDNPPLAGEGQVGNQESIQATIVKKSLERVTTNTGETFRLSESTLIAHADGQQVSIRKMLVPCEVEIIYVAKNGERMAERINIKQVSAGATWQLSAERPE